MAEFTFSPDGDVIISIRRDDGSFKHGKKHKRGVIVPRHSETPMHRRKSGFINFYDLGQVKVNSDWQDINFSVPLVYDSGDFNHKALSAANYNALRDLILATPIDDFETHYRKLTYEEAELYGLDIFVNSRQYSVARNGSRLDDNGSVVSDTQWTNKGLKMAAGDLTAALFFQSSGAFMNFDTSSYLKFTNTPNYAATGVEFVLLSNANVFLMPRLENIFGVSSRGGGGVNYDYDLIVFPYQALKRSFWLNRRYDISTGQYPILSSDGLLNNSLTSSDKIALLESLRPNGIEWDNISGNHSSPSAFPLYPGDVTLEIEDFANFVVPRPDWSAGALMAIIKQSSGTIYVWNDREGVIITNGREIDLSGL